MRITFRCATVTPREKGKGPDDRPQTASEVLRELAAIDTDPANVAEGAFTTQIEPPLPAEGASQETSAEPSESDSAPADKAAPSKT